MVDRTTIWKYPIVQHQVLAIPGFQRFLAVGLQEPNADWSEGTPTVWAIVDPEADKEAIEVWITMTGGPVVEGEYLGTFQSDWFVGHVFWRHA